MTSLKTHFKFTTPLLHTLSDFWTWWIEELGGILPKNVRAAILPSVERLYIAVNDEELIARQGTRESTHEIGRYPLTASTMSAEQVQEAFDLMIEIFDPGTGVYIFDDSIGDVFNLSDRTWDFIRTGFQEAALVIIPVGMASAIVANMAAIGAQCFRWRLVWILSILCRRS